MHVLGIVGSPRVNGNTDVLVDEILSGVRSSGGTIDKIYISDFDIKPCDSCMNCMSEKKCGIEDQWQAVADKLRAAEGLVIGSPVYWNCVSAQTKIFMDRCFMFLDENYDSGLSGKKGAFAVACGAPNEEMTALTRIVIEDFLKFNKIEIIGGIAASNMQERGSALKDENILARAFQIGRKFM